MGRRMDVAGKTAPGVILAFLDTPAKTVRALAGSTGWILVYAESVTAADAVTLPAILDQSRRDMAAQAPEEFAQAFANAAARSVGVRRNDAQIAAIARRLSGAAEPQ